MKRIIAVMSVICLLITPSIQASGAQRGLSKPIPQSTPFLNGAYHALIIGNNDYKDPEGLWAPLKTPVTDAEAVAEILRNLYGFPPENITLLKNATRADILKGFSDLSKKCGENDSVFIYYAGHGYSNPETKEAFWIPVDAVGKEDYTFVENSTIKTKLEVIADNTKHVLLVSDSCFSASLIREGNRGIKLSEKNDQYYQKVAQKKSVQIITAGGLEFVDDGYKNTGHSPFTHFFLKQLEYNTEKYYSATELSLEVTKAVSSNVFQTPEKGVLYGAGDNNGEFFFVINKEEKEPEPVQEQTQEAVETSVPPQSYDEEEEMWTLIKDSNNINDINYFLEVFPSGRLAPVAKLKLAQLERAQEAEKQASARGQEQDNRIASIPKTGPESPFIRRTDEHGLRLALFPLKTAANTVMAQKRLSFTIRDAIENLEGIGKIFFSEDFKRQPEDEIIGGNLLSDDIWIKRGFGSIYKPDTDRAVKIGKDLGVDAILMAYCSLVPNEGLTAIYYMIDVRNGIQYTAKIEGIKQGENKKFLDVGMDVFDKFEKGREQNIIKK